MNKLRMTGFECFATFVIRRAKHTPKGAARHWQQELCLGIKINWWVPQSNKCGLTHSLFIFFLLQRYVIVSTWPNKNNKKRVSFSKRLFFNYTAKILFHFSYDSLERFRMVNGQVCQNFTVDLDTSSVQSTHQARIRQTFHTSGSIDTLNPQSTEITFLVTTVAESISQTFFPCILRYSPNVLTCTIITTG